MKNTISKLTFAGGIVVALICGLTADAAKDFDPALFSMSIGELADISVLSASRTPQRLEDAPASVTVITENQIRLMGARDIYDILRLAPGIRLGQTNRGRTVVGVRGIRRETGDYVLFMLNGHVLNEPSNGSATFLLETANIPVSAIKRIEIIRGPTSALFGANAFLAVVNILTKTAADTKGSEVSFRTEWESSGNIGQEYNASIGQLFENGNAFFVNANVMDETGAEIRAREDRMGRSGHVDTEFEQIDVLGGLEAGPLTLNGRYMHQDRGEGFGAISILSPESQLVLDAFSASLELKVEPRKDLKSRTRAYLDYLEGETLLTMPGDTFPSDSPFRTQGVRSLLSLDNTKVGVETELAYLGFEHHAVSAGLLFEYESQDNLRVLKDDDGSGFPLPDMVDVSDTDNFGKDANRDIYAMFVEDVWDVSDGLRLNAGLRFDDYSDFGSSLNPRLGLTKRLRERCKLKLHYGTAFRAPDFRSLYLNSPVTLGNPDLSEEKIETFEAALESRYFDHLFVRVTYFHNELKDLISVPPGEMMLQNIRSAESDGVEVETRLDFSRGSYLSANYTYTDSAQDDRRFPDEPRHSGSAMASLALHKYLSTTLSLYWQGESPRQEGDARGDLPGYELINLTLLSQGWLEDLEVEFSVYNLLDEDYAYPSPGGSIPGDYNAPGRSFLLGLKYRI
ncbi:MAG: TonB-dependent receptor [Verrucomicrobia bacterium]|nr:TonB-dependent receptor [Verrucomicrobiota bacterium]